MRICPRLRLALTLFCLGMIVLHFAIFWLARCQIQAGSADFRIFYTAGLMLRDGHGHLLYSNDLQRRTQQKFARAFTHDGFLPYNHPPFEAMLFLAMAYLPYLPAYFLWLALNLLASVGCIYLLRPWLDALLSSFRWLVFLAPVAFYPVAYALLQGQDSILLLALYSLSYAAFRRARQFEAGLYLGLGLFKFHLVLPFAFVLLLRRQWRALWGIFLSASFELVISWALVGGKELFYYPHYAWRISRQSPIGVIFAENMPNLRGLFMGWMRGLPASAWLGMALIAVSLCLLVWGSRQWNIENVVDAHAWNAGFSIALLATFLVGYHSYNHDMAILLLPCLLTLNDLLERNSPEDGIGLKLALLGMFLTPLYLILSLRYFHANLFALVLLGFAGSLASFAKARPLASADRATALSTSQLR